MALTGGVALHTINVCIATKTGVAATGGGSKLISGGGVPCGADGKHAATTDDGVAPSFDRLLWSLADAVLDV